MASPITYHCSMTGHADTTESGKPSRATT